VILTLAISGYRSLRDVVLDLDQLTVVTGANGSGKSSFYRALRLMNEIAHGGVIGALAAALRTIYEIGARDAMEAAIEDAFPGAAIDVLAKGAHFELEMKQHGLLRPLSGAELSD
jgi:predicted ATPase